ncbi:Uncharacterised protein [Pseudomonas fluorescens]|uniref:Uncharacterized protein n=1 Tax=Pseudomonas fluorescens TaxID=294 RepID=A0A379IDS1_PSEFL|nr:hypothetical protein [Pseudomonas fluorescens]SUD30985.1 Uncharacterised protein [Pseudomonas fluorescens]
MLNSGGYFSRAERTALQLLIQRLIVAAGGIEQIGDYKVLVAHGGGKGSSHALAFLRAAQLTIAGRAPRSFQLRVATLRHTGMTQTALDSIHRGYSALFFHDDPRVELLMVENQEVFPFNHLRPASTGGQDIGRRNMLMVGHMSSGDIRASLCNDGYLSLGDFYRRITAWDGGVHALVSSDSPRKQNQYLAWLARTTRTAGMKGHSGRPLALNALFARMDDCSTDYYRKVYGEHYAAQDASSKEVHRHLAYIGVADLFRATGQDCTVLLNEFMGYRQDELAFQFSAPAYANPLLMAHLHGLHAQMLLGLDYQQGVAQFLDQAIGFMRRKNIPELLIAQAGTRDGRMLAATYAREFFGLEENQLVCLLFSPFIRQGQRLEAFLRRCHPGMLVALPELHKALQGKPSAELVQHWIVDTSGLPLVLLQHLYGTDVAANAASINSEEPTTEPYGVSGR